MTAEPTGYRLQDIEPGAATVVWRNTGTKIGRVLQTAAGDWAAFTAKGRWLGYHRYRAEAVEAVWLAETGLKPSTGKGA